MEARRDVARAQAALRLAAAEAEAAAAAAQEAAPELEGALARIADIRDPEVLEGAAPEEHGRPPAHAATGEAAVGAPEPTGGASASRGEAAQETEEPAEEETGGSEGTVAEELGEATVARRAQHAEVFAMAQHYDNDAEQGAAVRNWLEEHEPEFARPRGRASRYAPC